MIMTIKEQTAFENAMAKKEFLTPIQLYAKKLCDEGVCEAMEESLVRINHLLEHMLMKMN